MGQIDYAKLAQQHGGSVVEIPQPTPVDYAALAKQVESAQTPRIPGLATLGEIAGMAQRAGETVGNVGIGALKGAGSTAMGLATLANRYAPGRAQREAGLQEYAPSLVPAIRSALQTEGTAQRVGKGAEQIGEFFAPASALGKLKTAAQTGVGLLDAIAGLGAEGVSAAAVDSAQKGSVKDAATTGALAAGTGFAVKGLAKPVQAGADWLGQRIERSLLKPTMATLDGLTPSQLVANVFKHNVGGTLGQSYDKVQSALTQKVGELRTILKGAPKATVDLEDVTTKTLDDFLGNAKADDALTRILEHVEFGLNRKGVKLGTGDLNLADANIAKQAVGELGAWLHDVRGNVTSDADRVVEEVANKFYNHLKTSIEQNAKGPVAAVNKAIGELIPIKTAIIRRIPVAERSNVLNMGDLFSLSHSTLGLSLANRMLQSGRVANVMVGAGQASPGVSEAAARLAGASQ